MRFLANIGLFLFYWFFRFLLSLRYRIEIKGLKEVANSKEKGIIFLPNHPAEVDPLILTRVLWPKYQPRPLAVEHFYYQKGIRFFMDLLGTLPLPTMDVSNQWKVRQIEKLKNKILDLQREGENFLIYPSGKLRHTAEEKVGGASLIPDLLSIEPEMKLVLVRSTGLWGSSFSRALTGTTPSFGKTLWHGFKVLLKNGIFFAPRRHVLIELERAPQDFPRRSDKLTINQWLENWYNKNGPEPLTLVSYAFWKEDLPIVKQLEKSIPIEEKEIPKEMRDQILEFLSKIVHMPPEEIKADQHLSNDLGLDSLDASQLNVFLEERFDVTGISPGQIQTVGDAMEAGMGVKKEVVGPLPPKKKSKWPHEAFRPFPKMPPGETIQEVFLKVCERMGDSTACGDGTSGVLSYQKLKTAALVLSYKIREMPGENIGILLPSSVAAYTTILATLFAGKTPVMLNWTAGYRNLEHACEVSSLQVVLSSYRFLSRLENGDMGKVDDLLILLEEMRREIPLTMKLKGLFLSRRGHETILKKLPKYSKREENAVIIFTSGTETLPKGVPLTHKNILSSQRAAFSCVNFTFKDILYGVLPPFHSFGFSVTGLFPLLSGVKVCYAPDPTDARTMANDIEHWKPTLFCCAPSFIISMLRIAREEQLQSLRLIVAGAEKVPQELYDRFQELGKTLLEGYGISECSPIVTLEREGEPHKGVGRPIPGVELRVIDPETKELLPQGKDGEICISGPNVFNGYLGIKTDPFIEIENTRWYRSGDRGYIEEDGTLILTGRLKRFVKMGGEMVSLGGLEEDIFSICKQKSWGPAKEEGPILATVATGQESEKPSIIVFSTFEIDREELNRALKESGQSRLVKITEIRKIGEIPLTGTGKVQYRRLQEMVEHG